MPDANTERGEEPVRQRHSRRGDEAAEHEAGDDVGRVVRPHIDPGECHEDCEREHEVPEFADGEDQSDCDRAGYQSVVTHEGRILAFVDEDQDVVMRSVGARSIDDVRDRLVQDKGDHGRYCGPDRTGHDLGVVAHTDQKCGDEPEREQGNAVVGIASKEAVGGALRGMLDALTRVLPGRKRQTALASLSTMVGAVVLSRLADDKALAGAFLQAAAASILPAAHAINRAASMAEQDPV